jgi:streptogramin lyase
VHVIFWGSHFETSTEGKEVHSMVLKLFEGLTSSPYQGILTQYFDTTGRVGSSVTVGSYIDKSVEAPSNLNGTKVEEEVASAISTNKWTIEPSAQFVVETAPGSTYESGFPGGCAFHSYTSANAVYDFVPYQGDKQFIENGCVETGNPSKNPIRKTSKSTSHEYGEAATDPKINAWKAASGAEIADICQAQEDLELPDGAWVQNQYDDHQNKCSHEDLSPPHVYAISGEASSVTSTNATLNGTVNAESTSSHYYFELGTTISYGTKTTEVSAGSGVSNVAAKQVVCGLAASTTYHFRVAATNSTGTTFGEDKTFTTAASGGSGCPSATTEAASNIKTTEATLNGTVNPDGVETKYYFEYGTSVSYGKNTSEVSAGSGTSNVKVNQTITGLTKGTEYHFRLIAVNSTGTTYGADKTLKTTTGNPPAVTTGSATGITESGATLNGTVNPEGTETKYYFEYGTTESFGSKTAEASAGSGTIAVEVSKAITGLTASTTYYYRIVATNSGGTTYGATKTFATSAKPTAETKLATSVGETTATLKGTVNPKGAETKYYFEYGTSTSYGSKTAEASAGSGTSNVEVSKEITGLARNTKYDFRLVATNLNGTTDGANQEFTTLSSVITGSANGITATEAVVHGTVNPHGLATTDQFEYGLTTSYGTTVPVPAESAGSGTTVVAKGYILTGLLPGTTYHFRLVEINSEGTTDGKDATFTTSALTTEFVSAFGSAGTGNGQFDEPTGIGVNPINGAVVVSDEKNNRVQVFNEKGEFVRTFGTEGTGNGQFKEPRGVAVDSKGNIWVTDTGNNRIEEFNEKGEYLAQVGAKGTGNGQFTEPKGLAVDSKGNIWVADSGNSRVQEFNEKREYVRQFAAGTNPIGIAVDSKGNVWSDNEDEIGAVEEHNEKGEVLQKFATRGEGKGQVLEPKRLAVDSAGDVWVPDAGNNRVDVFNERGELLRSFGTYGTGSEQMEYPTGVAVDHGGHVWIADDENNRVDQWTR